MAKSKTLIVRVEPVLLARLDTYAKIKRHKRSRVVRAILKMYLECT
jgi:hypothetical protein